MKTYIVECVECQKHYNRDRQRYCPNCGEKDYNDIDLYEVRQKKLNDMDLGEYLVTKNHRFIGESWK